MRLLTILICLTLLSGCTTLLTHIPLEKEFYHATLMEGGPAKKAQYYYQAVEEAGHQARFIEGQRYDYWVDYEWRQIEGGRGGSTFKGYHKFAVPKGTMQWIDHYWVEVKVNGKWLMADPCYKDEAGFPLSYYKTDYKRK